jgi:hypothetical protein
VFFVVRFSRALTFCIFLLIFAVPAFSGELVDGIAATVNGVAILYSDLDVAVRSEALLDGRSLESVTTQQRQEALERLIDQELLRQQMGPDVAAPSADTLAARLQQVRAQLPEAREDAGWLRLLHGYGLTEQEFSARISAQMQITGYLQSRLRSTVRIDPAAVQSYYREKLLPELRKRGVTSDPPLAELTGTIEEILRQERMNELLVSWLQRMRQQARIRTAPEASPEPAGSSGWRSETTLSAAGK